MLYRSYSLEEKTWNLYYSKVLRDPLVNSSTLRNVVFQTKSRRYLTSKNLKIR